MKNSLAFWFAKLDVIPSSVSDGIASIAQKNRMSSTPHGAILAIMLDMGQRLPVDPCQGRDKTPCHADVLNRALIGIMHKNI